METKCCESCIYRRRGYDGIPDADICNNVKCACHTAKATTPNPTDWETKLWVIARGLGTFEKNQLLNLMRYERQKAKEAGVREGRNKERGHLRFLYRWISRLNGDKEHDRPETEWKTYVSAMVHYPLSPWQTGDWFEEDLVGPSQEHRVDTQTIKVSEYVAGKTKWGGDPYIEVSFQRLQLNNGSEERYCCYQGDGHKEGIIGWGNTKKLAVKDLLERIREHGGLLF